MNISPIQQSFYSKQQKTTSSKNLSFEPEFRGRGFEKLKENATIAALFAPFFAAILISVKSCLETPVQNSLTANRAVQKPQPKKTETNTYKPAISQFNKPVLDEYKSQAKRLKDKKSVLEAKIAQKDSLEKVLDAKIQAQNVELEIISEKLRKLEEEKQKEINVKVPFEENRTHNLVPNKDINNSYNKSNEPQPEQNKNDNVEKQKKKKTKSNMGWLPFVLRLLK